MKYVVKTFRLTHFGEVPQALDSSIPKIMSFRSNVNVSKSAVYERGLMSGLQTSLGGTLTSVTYITKKVGEIMPNTSLLQRRKMVQKWSFGLPCSCLLFQIEQFLYLVKI